MMSGSFRKYTDMKNEVDDLESGGGGVANDASQFDSFMQEIEMIKEDVKAIEKVSKRLNETNEESKTIQFAAKMRDLRALMDSDTDHVLMFAKSIIQRIDGLERLSNNNTNLDKRATSAASSINRTQISVVLGLGKRLRAMMDEFQGLRVRTAAVYRETIEHKYFSITGEKHFIEEIEVFVANGEFDDCLNDAIQEHDKDLVVDFIAEMHERQQGFKNMQRNLVELHKMFLDMTGLVEVQAQKIVNYNGGENNNGQVAPGTSVLKPNGVAQLQDQNEDYDREAKRRATIGLILAVFLLFMIIIPLFVAESNKDME